MILRSLGKILLSFLLLCCAVMADASPVSVQAKLDSVNLLMGNMTTVHLIVKQPKDLKGDFPLLRQVRDTGVIPVCGDSVELRSPSRVDTVVSGNSLTITYDVPVQAFDSGYYRLPEFAFVSNGDTAFSKSLSIKVVPVLAEANTPINDYASVSDPENPSIFDWVPDWVVDFWWLFLLLALAIVATFYAYRRYRRVGTLLPKKPEPTPYELAVARLRELKENKLWEQGLEKEYYTELTDILRRYLYGRFGINAVEMTSRQILAALSKNKDTSDKRSYFRQILDMADFVKFAKVRPLPDDNVLALDNAVRFVEETKPQPIVEEVDVDSQNGESRKKSGGIIKKAAKGGAK